MKLTDRLKMVAQEAAVIRKGLTIHNPHDPAFSADFAREGQERALGATAREAGMRECARLFADVYEGRRPTWHLQEAMTTSDFPLLFGDLLYRQLLGNYTPWPVTYPGYFRIMDLNDFRNMNLYTIDGGQGILPPVAQSAPYPEVKFVEGRYQISVAKYGQRYGITFEMVINDDLNAFQQRPLMMATACRRSEEYLATQQMCDVNGPHAAFFTAGNKNIITSNPALSLPALQTAFKVIAAQKDKDGQPIMLDMVNLVVTPNDEVTARNILGASQLRINDATGGASAGQFMYVNNWMNARVTLHVNPYIPIIASAATANPWFLISNAKDMTQRPAFMFGFMRGRRNPQLMMKDPNQQALGGGDMDIREGNFDNDTIDYKVRHIFGAAQGDPIMAASSNGTGA